MDVTLAPEQRELHRVCTELLDEELAPLIRRMADRPRHGDATAEAPDNAPLRAMLWQALTDLGALRLGGDGHGLQSLAVVAERLGEVLYQGPLPDTVLAAEALLRSAPGGTRDRFRKEIGAGAPVAAAVRDGALRPDEAPLVTDEALETITAERRFVAYAAEADYLLIPGRTADGVRRTALVRRDHPTVRLRRHEELGRGELYAVRLSGTPVAYWLDLGSDPEGAWRRLLASARIVQAACLVGLSQGALRLATAYAKERRQFGGPLGRRQAPAFRLARTAARIDAARMLTRAAAWEADSGVDPRLTAAQALAMAGDLAREASRDALQIHGARGMTEACDAQLFYRRAAVESVALGSPARLRAEVLPLLLAKHADRTPSLS
ncbi:acyl-CoA dehydrogenase family protein [Streptomyces sp. KR80]|uniref:acyl-CoA dehydrogenase family protein n=1 Tax=Streptomyces sp. KR80 TaxID=3457426 RepID=UPI003FD45374